MTKSKILKLTFVALSLLFMASCTKDKTGKLTFEVKDAESVAVSRAMITVNNQELTTDAQGMASLELDEGSYNYTVKKEGFLDYTGSITMGEDDFTEKVTLSQTLVSGSFELNVSDRKKWYYFSFKDGLVGEGSADPAEGDDAAWKEKDNWDIAFHYSNVRTNGGTSGNGQAGVFEMESNVMAEVTTAPETDYVVDTEIRIFLNMPPTNPAQDIKDVPGNTVLDLWADFDHDTMVWSINDHIFVVRTADGKYAKIQFTNYLDEEDHGGLMKFNYVYQTDGSMNF